MTETLVQVFLLTGSLFIFIGALGVVRLPDVLCRAHALSKALTLGTALLLIALWIALGTEKVDLKILLALVFLIITIPLAGHLFALLAYRNQVPLEGTEDE